MAVLLQFLLVVVPSQSSLTAIAKGWQVSAAAASLLGLPFFFSSLLSSAIWLPTLHTDPIEMTPMQCGRVSKCVDCW
jgi:hypothetical protein